MANITREFTSPQYLGSIRTEDAKHTEDVQPYCRSQESRGSSGHVGAMPDVQELGHGRVSS
eukprot:11190937-Lingulodinium_polyedra.AAC.1